MSNSDNSLFFQKSNIAELNSILLFDYEQSLKKYYKNKDKSNSSLKLYKWFNYSKFNTNENSFLNDFEEYIVNFVFRSST